jgi:hypothetical protein
MRSLATNACGTPHRDAPPRSDDPDAAERWAKRSGPEGIAGAAGRPLRSSGPAAPRGTRLRFKISGCCPLRTLP